MLKVSAAAAEEQKAKQELEKQEIELRKQIVEAMKIEVVKGVYGHLSLNVRQHARARLRSLRAALPGRAPATMAELGQRVEAVAESILRDEARQLGRRSKKSGRWEVEVPVRCVISPSDDPWDVTHRRFSKTGSECGCRPVAIGDVLLPTCSGHLAFWAARVGFSWAARIGVILVNINPAYRTAEVEYALNKVGCKAIVAAEAFKDMHRAVYFVGHSSFDLAGDGEDEDMGDPDMRARAR